MQFTEIVMDGTLKPDGTLELDAKPNLAPGRVKVVLRQAIVPELPKDDPFWQRMQGMWDAQDAEGHVPRSVEEIESEQKQMREGWERHQQAIERLQEECRNARASVGEPKL